MAHWAVDDKALFGFHRPPVINRDFRHVRLITRELKVFQQLAERQIERAVNHQTQCAIRAVFGDEGHGLREVRIVQAGHGDQELVL